MAVPLVPVVVVKESLLKFTQFKKKKIIFTRMEQQSLQNK
jgi:hypothetical protein